MSDQDYKNRELDEKFSDIQKMLTRIETQTNKTNGRVNWLEKTMYMALGALAILTPFTGWLTTDYLRHRGDSDKVSAQQVQALQQAVSQGISERFDVVKK